MSEETAFLSAISNSPADDTARLAYADWLDERGDPAGLAKARFLRLTVGMKSPDRPPSDDEQLRGLAADLDTDWLGVVSRLKVEGCRGQLVTTGQVASFRQEFEVLCDQTWDEMTPTGDGAVRRCERCRENVHYCDTIVVARHHARLGRCVAVDLGVARQEGDLAPARVMLRGKISVERMRRLRARQRAARQVDPVSEERERRKREQG